MTASAFLPGAPLGGYAVKSNGAGDQPFHEPKKQKKEPQHGVKPLFPSIEEENVFSTLQSRTASLPPWVASIYKDQLSTGNSIGKSVVTEPIDDEAVLDVVEYAARKGFLHYQRCHNLNYNASRSPILSHEFDPAGRIMVTCGARRLLQVFSIAGEVGAYQAKVELDYPVMRAKFCTPDYGTVLCAGHRDGFYLIKLETLQTHQIRKKEFYDNDMSLFDVHAEDGNLVAFSNPSSSVTKLVDLRCLRAVGRIHTENNVGYVHFDPHSAVSPLLWVCNGSQVSLWDLRKSAAGTSSTPRLYQHHDEGGLHISSFAISPELYAVGSEVGIVNIYGASLPRGYIKAPLDENASKIKERGCKPSAVLKNLRTAITSMRFDPTARRLVYASQIRKNLVRMYDTRSKTIFQNFPNAHHKSLGRISSVRFLPSSNLCTLGSSRGRVHTYKLTEGKPLEVG